MAFSPDGRWLALGGPGTTAVLYDIPADRNYSIDSDSGWVTALAFSTDSKTLAVGGLGGEVKLWNVAARREMISFKAHTTMVNDVAFSHHGDLLVSGGVPALRLWSAPGSRETVMPRLADAK